MKHPLLRSSEIAGGFAVGAPRTGKLGASAFSMLHARSSMRRGSTPLALAAVLCAIVGCGSGSSSSAASDTLAAAPAPAGDVPVASCSFSSIRIGVKPPIGESELERAVLAIRSGMPLAEVPASVFGPALAWQTEAGGKVWGGPGWSACALEFPNKREPEAPGRAVTGETTALRWYGAGSGELPWWPSAELAPSMSLRAGFRAGEEHWRMAQDPVAGFRMLTATAAPNDPALPPVDADVPLAIRAVMSDCVAQRADFAGNRNMRAGMLSASTRESPSRHVWAAWWGAPDSPFVHGVIGWSIDIDWPLDHAPEPAEVGTLYPTEVGEPRPVGNQAIGTQQ